MVRSSEIHARYRTGKARDMRPFMGTVAIGVVLVGLGVVGASPADAHPGYGDNTGDCIQSAPDFLTRQEVLHACIPNYPLGS